MSIKKEYLLVFLINILYSVMQIFQKSALNHGMNASVFVFYRQVFALLFLAPIAFTLERKRAPPLPFIVGFKMFLLALIGITTTLNLYSAGLSYTSPTLASASKNSVPVTTFILAALLRMESIKAKEISGIAKLLGVALCLAGITTIALYEGIPVKPISHHHLLAHENNGASRANNGEISKSKWVLGTFLMFLSHTTWSLWIVLQGPLLKVYPSKLLFTTFQCLFSTIQSLLVALAVERDFSRWKLSFDVSLLSVAYSGIIITGVSYYLQSWCIAKRGPVFFAMWVPLTLIITIACSLLILGEAIHLGSILGGILLVVGLYSVLWGKSKERKDDNIPLSQRGNASLEDKGTKEKISSNEAT